MIILRFAVMTYLMIAFIEWDLLCLNWTSLYTPTGRAIFLFYILLIINHLSKNYEYNTINKQPDNDKTS